MPNWDNVGNFERFEKLNDVLMNVGNSAVVVFMDDGRDVSKEVMQKSLKEKKIKGINARDSVVFRVQENKKNFEFWLSATAFSNLTELKIIRTANNNTLIGAKAKISRVSVRDPEQQSYKIESA